MSRPTDDPPGADPARGPETDRPDGADRAEASPRSILERAAQRGRGKDLPYLGEVTPAEAWALRRAGAARIVDVRTRAEWTYVGRIEGVPLVEWRAFGASQPNPDFLDQLREHAPDDLPVLFLCRSAVRSHAAAQLAHGAGWTALNVLEGFEGDLDEHGHRGTLGGWRRSGLPWVQS
jgi:rhodanese-related sulfurtransferase